VCVGGCGCWGRGKVNLLSAMCSASIRRVGCRLCRMWTVLRSIRRLLIVDTCPLRCVHLGIDWMSVAGSVSEAGLERLVAFGVSSMLLGPAPVGPNWAVLVSSVPTAPMLH